MDKEVNRYTLNFIINNKEIPFALANIQEIDRLFTNFDNKNELINHISEYANIDYFIEDINATYNVQKQQERLEFIYRPARAIVDDFKLIDRIITYISYYPSLRNLNLNNLHNSYLKNLLSMTLSQDKAKDFNFRLLKIREKLEMNYKLKRDLTLFIESERAKQNRQFLMPTNYIKNIQEADACIEKMKNVYDQSQITLQKPDQVKSEGDDQLEYLPQKPNYMKADVDDQYLEELLKKGDFDTISRYYSLDRLNAYGVDIFDGTHNPEQKSHVK
ncbi:MAG: hypothetical protein WC343_02585 [Bacilli bacterium]|jgi:hypothetical protein